jgi:hypothetical protein
VEERNGGTSYVKLFISMLCFFDRPSDLGLGMTRDPAEILRSLTRLNPTLLDRIPTSSKVHTVTR